MVSLYFCARSLVVILAAHSSYLIVAMGSGACKGMCVAVQDASDEVRCKKQLNPWIKTRSNTGWFIVLKHEVCSYCISLYCNTNISYTILQYYYSITI